MVRLALLTLLLCSPSVLGQVDPSQSGEPATEEAAALRDEVQPDTPGGLSEPVDAAEADLIGRINDEIDRRAGADDAEGRTVFPGRAQPDAMSSLMRAIFALSVVLALILFVYYGVRKWGRNVPLLAGSSLGTVLGRIHLERGTTLHFLRTGGRVLIVGVNGNAVSLVADFEAAEFESAGADSPAELSEAPAPFNPDSFLEQLQASSRTMESPYSFANETPIDDDEIAALRGDIQRLQRYLREESREPQD